MFVITIQEGNESRPVAAAQTAGEAYATYRQMCARMVVKPTGAKLWSISPSGESESEYLYNTIDRDIRK